MNTEVVVALCSVVVVMIALAVGVWQAAVTRAHNRKSVQPVLQLSSAPASVRAIESACV